MSEKQHSNETAAHQLADYVELYAYTLLFFRMKTHSHSANAFQCMNYSERENETSTTRSNGIENG